MGFKVAEVTSKRSDLKTIRAYLPHGYVAFEDSTSESDLPTTIYIVGVDIAGWTMQDYVIPRLASGLHSAVELETWDTATKEDLTFLVGEPESWIG